VLVIAKRATCEKIVLKVTLPLEKGKVSFWNLISVEERVKGRTK
jgi:hypothetical protein